MPRAGLLLAPLSLSLSLPSQPCLAFVCAGVRPFYEWNRQFHWMLLPAACCMRQTRRAACVQLVAAVEH